MFGIDRLDEVEELLNEIYEEIPQRYWNRLTGGVVISEEVKYHPESRDHQLIIMGQYERNFLGNRITIFYGSVMEVYWDLVREELKEKLRDILTHELTHHLEYEARENDLELEDLRQLENYRKRGKYE